MADTGSAMARSMKLKIVGRNALQDFEYGAVASWQALTADVDGTMLGTRTAGVLSAPSLLCTPALPGKGQSGRR